MQKTQIENILNYVGKVIFFDETQDNFRCVFVCR